MTDAEFADDETREMYLERFADEVCGHLNKVNLIIERLTRERDEALRETNRYAREAGEAIGKLAMCETAGIVDDWRERAEAAERERDVWRDRAEAAEGITVTGV